MKALVVLNGECEESFLETLVDSHDFIVGVDGGNSTLLKLGIEPDLSLGDFDSFDPSLLKSEVLRYPSKKDEIDAELALRTCWDRGFEGVSVACWMGERIDMVYALLGILGSFPQGWVVLTSEKLRVGVVKSKMVLEAKEGELWSILPIGGRSVLSLRGFEYELERSVMTVERPYGVSNVSLSSSVEIEVHEGKVVYFRWLKRPS